MAIRASHGRLEPADGRRVAWRPVHGWRISGNALVPGDLDVPPLSVCRLWPLRE